MDGNSPLMRDDRTIPFKRIVNCITSLFNPKLTNQEIAQAHMNRNIFWLKYSLAKNKDF